MEDKNVFKVVVVNENIFGYINPESPNTVYIFNTKRESNVSQYAKTFHVEKDKSNIRLAKNKDFADFNTLIEQFEGQDESRNITYDWDKG